jgi:hypothetical protein
MTKRATGEFDVKLAPLALDDKAADSDLGRMSIDKQFRGDLVGTGKGEMLSARTATPNSAGYVAIEKVAGTLAGRSGTFVFQHSSTMSRGEPQQSVSVVPDSGTGDLAGIAGKMTIKIVDKKHHYEFEYTLPEKN